MSNRTICTAAAALLLCFCLPAQEATEQAPVTSTSQDRQTEPVLINLMFPGGTMAAFLASVRAVVPEANIVPGLHVDEAQVPAMELRSVDLKTALNTACMVATGPVNVRVNATAGGGQWVYTMLARGNRPDDPQAQPADETVQRVFSLNGLTMSHGPGSVAPLSVESILSAIELVTTADGKGPMLRYHKDSGLLLVRGTQEQVRNAMETLSVLADDLRERNTWARQAGPTHPADGEKKAEAR